MSMATVMLWPVRLSPRAFSDMPWPAFGSLVRTVDTSNRGWEAICPLLLCGTALARSAATHRTGRHCGEEREFIALLRNANENSTSDTFQGRSGSANPRTFFAGHSRKECEHDGIERDRLHRASDAPGPAVPPEDCHRCRVLIAAEQPTLAGIEREVPGRLAAARNALYELQSAVFPDGDDDQRVLATIRCVEIVAVGRDSHLRSRILRCGKAGSDGLHQAAGIDQDALRVRARAGRCPKKLVDGGIELIDGVDPAATGMEGDMAWAAAAPLAAEESGWSQPCRRRIDCEDGDRIRAEVANQQ